MFELAIAALTLGACGTFYWRKFGTPMNPPTLFSFSLVSALSSLIVGDSLDLLRGFDIDEAHPLVPIYALGSFCFLLPWMAVGKKRFSRSGELWLWDHKHVVVYLHTFAISALAGVGVSIVVLGSVPILEMIRGSLHIQEHVESVRQLPVGLLSAILLSSILLALYAASLLCNQKAYRFRVARNAHIILGALFLSLWQGNRQLLLIFLIVVFARASLRARSAYPIRISKRYLWLGLSCVAFFALFTSVQYVRLQGEGASYTELLQYFTYSPLNLISIVSNYSPLGQSQVPTYLLREIVPFRFLGDDYQEIAKSLFEPTAPAGYFSYWYLDFGYTGVALGAILLCCVSVFFFATRNRSEGWMRMYILVLWCCATVSIYSHLISLNFFILPLLVLICIELLSRKVCYGACSNIAEGSPRHNVTQP
jgi:oligosaccharide repeat unit polymerase